MASTKAAYASSAAITATALASLATSSTLVAGYSLAETDNTSDLHLDKAISGAITVGTTPTVGTWIEVWCIPKKNDSSYHDTFDGTAKAVTVTSREMLDSYGKLIRAILVPVNTSNVAYHFQRSLAAAYEGLIPAKFQIWVVHSTAVNLNSTGGNHSVDQKGAYSTTA